MPAGRIGVAAAALRRWCSESLGPDDVLITWDEESAAVGRETSQPIGMILDGLSGGSATRTMSMVLADRHAAIVAASPAVQHAVGVVAPAAAAAAVPPPLDVREQAAGDAIRVHLAAEPLGGDQCRPLVPLLGRLRLLGRNVSIQIAGTPERAMHVVDMLRAVGVHAVECGPPGILAAGVRRGDLVWCGGVVQGGEAVLPVGPAAAAWGAGGVVLLPTGHAAEQALADCGGVLRDVDTRPDDAVRHLDAAIADAQTADRREQANGWFQVLLEAVAAGVNWVPTAA